MAVGMQAAQVTQGVDQAEGDGRTNINGMGKNNFTEFLAVNCF
uniref:Uncharacterized protein n=1 Tax=Desertifilum tharense IPPAS B-1220 TaxID=1781255 RepID=A0ACD5GXA2_9CYAN